VSDSYKGLGGFNPLGDMADPILGVACQPTTDSSHRLYITNAYYVQNFRRR